MKIHDLYIFEILIHFYPNLVVKLEKLARKLLTKKDIILGKIPVNNRHNFLKLFANDPYYMIVKTRGQYDVRQNPQNRAFRDARFPRYCLQRAQKNFALPFCSYYDNK